MAEQSTGAWKCNVCGYVHRGAAPPDWCPVCGAAKEAFEPYKEAAPAAKAKANRWRCLNCQYIHEGPQPPKECPVCGAPADRFEPLIEAAEKAGAAGAAIKVVVVGAGIAGVAAVDALRSTAPQAEITVISKEPDLPYYRLNLTRYLAGEVDAAALPIHPQSWYDEQRVRLMLGEEVAALHLDRHAVALRSGGEEPFDKLILAIGAHPFMPPFPGVNREGVTSFRTMHDADAILAAAKAHARCVCIGGGVLGLETAGALARQGADVTLLEGHGWLMPRQVTQTAGDILARHVASVGIKLKLNAMTSEIVGDERVRGVVLKDDSELPADMAVVATGIRANSYLARTAGLEVNKGVVVNNLLGTSHPAVLAAGDVAEHRGILYGIWPASQAQGSIAGLNAAGLAAEFGGIPRSNTLKVLGLDLFSIGVIEPQDGSYAAIDQEADDGYFRFVFHDGAMVGSILLGDTALTTTVKKAIEKRRDFSGLLAKRPTADDVRNHLAETGA